MIRGSLDNALCHLQHALDDAARGQPDALLVGRFVGTRDEQAFAAILSRHGPMVLATCKRILRTGADVEDAFQATFLVLLHKAASLRRPEQLGGWLHGVACRISLMARSDSARRHRLDQERAMCTSEAAGAPPSLDAAEACAILDVEVDRLPAVYRAPLVLCYLAGKTRAQAAAQLGWKEGTVAGRLARAKDLLRRRLVRRGVSVTALGGVFALPASPLAAMPIALAQATERGIAHVAAGQPVALEFSAHVIALSQGVLKAMLTSKIKFVALALLAFALTAGGSFAIWAAQGPGANDGQAEDQRGEKPNALAAQFVQPPDKKEEPKKDPDKKAPEIELPKDPKAVVIRLDFLSGNSTFMPKRPPVLSITADGAVEVTDPLTKKNAKGKLTAKELGDLMRFAVAEKQFFKADSLDVQTALTNAIRDAGKVFADGIDVRAPVTHLSVRTKDKDQEVICPSVEFCARNYPKCDEVVRLAEVQARLEEIIKTVKAKPAE